ncbi:hypothetical protein NHQ30_010713 [Ciborinia camelliae]|nr:hypothetical protein NHQ30_010713 [Ciborinia camelliae]
MLLQPPKNVVFRQSNIWIFDVLGQDIPDGFKSFKEPMNHGETDWVRFNNKKTCSETTATRLFSSGTTGLPKAAARSHYNLIAQHTLVYEQGRDRIRYISSLSCSPQTFQSERTILDTPSTGTTNVPRSLCLRFIHTPPMSPEQVVKTEKSRTYKRSESRTCLYPLVPRIVIAIIMSGHARNKLKAVKHARIGAAPLGKESQNKLKQLCAPGATVNRVWGMTETSCIGSMFYHWEDDTTGSVGRILPNFDAKMINEEGNDITAYDILSAESFASKAQPLSPDPANQVTSAPPS